MRRSFPLLLVFTACASAGRIPPSVPPPLEAEHGVRFSIICHFACGEAAGMALSAAERAWQRTTTLFGVDARGMSPRPIHLYGTEDHYEAVEGALTGGRLRLNRAMTYRGEEAHISVHPYLTAEARDEFGLTTNTLRVIAHEAAHIASRTLAPRTRALPDWLDEGISSWVEQSVLIDLGLSVNRAEEPVSGTRSYLLKDRLQRDQMPSLSTLLDGQDDMFTLAERYAFYQIFFQFVLESRYGDRMTETLRQLDRFRGSGGRLGRAIVKEVFDREMNELSGLQAEFHEYLRTLEPGWVEAKRALSVSGENWLQVGFDAGAEAWRWNPVPELPYTLSGQVRILAGGAETASVMVALEGGGKLSIRMRPHEVRIDRLTTARDRTRDTVARTPLASLRPGAAVTFRVRVDRNEVVAEVADLPPLTATDVQPSGRWGLEAGPAANVIWRGVSVEETNR
jgi:hypothetical protein